MGSPLLLALAATVLTSVEGTQLSGGGPGLVALRPVVLASGAFLAGPVVSLPLAIEALLPGA